VGSFRANKAAVALKLPFPESFRAGPLNITVQEDEFRVAILVRVASFALVDQLMGVDTRRLLTHPGEHYTTG
jgi:hypothetical protein